MKVIYSTADGRLQFEFEATSGKEAFGRVAEFQETFEEAACGCCNSDAIRCEVRHFEGNAYHKLLCNECGATLDFGQHKDTTRGLFAKRKDDTRKRLPARGWYRYGETTAPLALETLPVWLASKPTAAALNSAMPQLATLHNGQKATAWKMLRDYAAAAKIGYDETAKRFVS
jgi:hypothetical protein